MDDATGDFIGNSVYGIMGQFTIWLSRKRASQ